jgi:outer membrane protein assembly factor BamB
MKRADPSRRLVHFEAVPLAILVILALALPSHAGAAWTQWGGPNGDFTCDAGNLALKWRESGPAEIWSREIGLGHSTILHDDGVLYTMDRRDDKDAILAIDADTGKTIWEYRYDAPPKPGMLQDYGVGPHASPLIAGDRVFSIGGMTHFNCLDKKTGQVLWSRDLSEEFGATAMLRGYGSSPMAYKDLVIVNIGAGRGAEDPAGLAAFKQDTGEVVWKSEQLIPGYPTPILTEFNGQDMLIGCLGITRFALDPATGVTLWKAQVDRQSGSIITSPLWVPPDKVFFSAGHGGGSRLYQIHAAKDGTYSVEELWYHNKFRIMHGNAVRSGDHVYGSSGDLGPAYLMAVDLTNGELKWRKRGFSKSTLLFAEGKLIILDEDGNLAVATATPEKLEIHARAKVLQRLSWTAPTLIGTRLYLRDEHAIKCLDLGIAANQ